MRAEGTPQELRVVISVSEHSELASLERWLQSVPEVRVERRAGMPGAGEQGVLDELVLFAGSGGVITAIKVLPEFLRAKRSGISVTTIVKDKPFTMTVTNVEEVLPIIQQLLDD